MAKRTYTNRLQVTNTPFDTIGLAFSGGGFRAASYSLGNLSYLNEVKQLNGKTLLENVTYISSASGGTITNGMYALHCAEGKDFGTFYRNLFENLEGVKLLNVVFEKLNDDAVWKKRPNKRRNIINAFALAYDELLFDGKFGDDIMAPTSSSHLEEVCFNTTDFYKGLLFRQALKLKKDSKKDETFLYGNFLLHLKDNAERNLKLADMLAASSCFPGGFEPIVFPGDFTNERATKKILLSSVNVHLQELSWEETDRLYSHRDIAQSADRLPKPIDVAVLDEDLQLLPLMEDVKMGFMDGGITDNQGIESLIRANERRQNKETDFKEFDLMMINDVGSAFMDPYQPSAKNTYKGVSALTLRTIRIFSVIMALGGVAGLFVSFCCVQDIVLAKILAIVSALVVIVFGGLYAGIQLLKRFIKGNLQDGAGLNLDKNFSPAIVERMFDHFGRTPVGIIGQMLKERFTSFITLNADVFLKRIRELLYQRFLSDGRSTYRMKTNHIYDLSFANDLNRKYDSNEISPSEEIQIVAQSAFEMGTTLWFDTKNQQEFSQAALIACGQFTMCYNLLEYIHRLKATKDHLSYFSTLSPEYQAKVNALEIAMKRDYENFKQDPFWLYNKLGEKYTITNFKKCDMSRFHFPKDFKGLR